MSTSQPNITEITEANLNGSSNKLEPFFIVAKSKINHIFGSNVYTIAHSFC